MTDDSRCGYIAIVGKPNVGKSTLFNRLIKAYLSPVTHKRQTTRSNIKGILTEVPCQMIFVDTPGLDQACAKPFNRMLNENAERALYSVDVVVMLIEQGRWNNADEALLEKVKWSGKPCLLVLNKCDRVQEKERLLSMIDKLRQRHDFADIFPLSALKDPSLEPLKQVIAQLLPVREHEFAADQLSDRSESFICGELIREQLMNELHQEIPYMIHVAIEKFTDTPSCVNIDALIFVQKENHRPMVIGNKGTKLKRIGTNARHKIEHFLGKKVFLRLKVKVQETWQSDMEIVKSYLD